MPGLPRYPGGGTVIKLTPEEAAKSADARLRALAPHLYTDPKLKPHAWPGIRRVEVVSGYDEGSGYASGGWWSAISITPAALDYLLACAEAIGNSGNAPALPR